MSNVKLKVSTKKDNEGKDYFEGTVTMQGLKPAKLQKSDGTTRFGTKSSVSNAARSFAKRVGMDLELDQPTQKAAKKSSKTKRRKSTSSTCTDSPCSTSTCSG